MVRNGQPRNVNRDRFLVPAIVLSALGAVVSLVMGLGAGLSEDPGYWFFYVQAALFAAVTGLCASARGRG